MSFSSHSHTPELVPNFIKKLTSILNDKQNSTSVKWMNDGNGFKIINDCKFTTQILPKYYRHCNMPSFVRQLNMYGFHKIKDGEENYYKHPFFKRNEPQHYCMISRKPEKKSCAPESSNNQEKENTAGQKKEIHKRTNKKVNFSEITPLSSSEDKIKKNEKSDHKTKKQLMSNVSLRFDRSNRMNSKIFQDSQMSPDILYKQKNDQVSIFDKVEERGNMDQFFNSTKKLIFCTPSQMLLNLNEQN